MANKTEQQGFSVIAVVALMAVATLIALTGWYIWDRNNTNKANNTTPSSSSSTTQKPTNSKQQNDPTEGGKYLVIKEWGIKFEMGAELRGASYSYIPPTSDNAGTAYFTSGLQGTISEPCASNLKTAWGIIRYNPDDLSPIPADEQTGTKLKDSTNVPNEAVRKLGDFYFQRVYPQTRCSDDQDNRAMRQIDQEYKRIFTEMLPSS